MSAAAQCKGCRFWKFLDNQPDTVGEMNGFGICRRYPPTRLDPDHHEGDYPHCMEQPWTPENMWCGEFKPR